MQHLKKYINKNSGALLSVHNRIRLSCANQFKKVQDTSAIQPIFVDTITFRNPMGHGTLGKPCEHEFDQLIHHNTPLAKKDFDSRWWLKQETPINLSLPVYNINQERQEIFDLLILELHHREYHIYNSIRDN
ncbi:unnamed protein product [Albugo candida]|uniref:Uncharacterized protein n=1 Tax=Albugo candida TaxID=65357 RepID=A0A024G785_9STRA|nr:unnamed protein product [Albugo candida]|eukprot:CCI42741.1 unnamed protein product [Albugo candida]